MSMFFLQAVFVFLLFTIPGIFGNDLFSYSAKDLDGNTVSLSKYADAKVVLIGNISPV